MAETDKLNIDSIIQRLLEGTSLQTVPSPSLFSVKMHIYTFPKAPPFMGGSPVSLGGGRRSYIGIVNSITSLERPV